jgi:hypothetical protein
MRILFVTHHLGLGDHLLCNGLYRSKAAEFDYVYLVVRRHYRGEMKRMLGDLNNLRIISFPKHVADRAQFVLRSIARTLRLETLSLGFFGEDFFRPENHRRFDEDFYYQARVPMEQRWSSFSFVRDREAEEKIFLELGCDQEPYIFLHEDSSRGFLINRERIQSNLKIVTPNAKTNFFNYAKVLENATELHLMESSFAALAEGMELSQPKYAHRYARPEALADRRHEFTYKGEWEVLK